MPPSTTSSMTAIISPTRGRSPDHRCWRPRPTRLLASGRRSRTTQRPVRRSWSSNLRPPGRHRTRALPRRPGRDTRGRPARSSGRPRWPPDLHRGRRCATGTSGGGTGRRGATGGPGHGRERTCGVAARGHATVGRRVGDRCRRCGRRHRSRLALHGGWRCARRGVGAVPPALDGASVREPKGTDARGGVLPRATDTVPVGPGLGPGVTTGRRSSQEPAHEGVGEAGIQAEVTAHRGGERGRTRWRPRSPSRNAPTVRSSRCRTTTTTAIRPVGAGPQDSAPAGAPLATDHTPTVASAATNRAARRTARPVVTVRHSVDAVRPSRHRAAGSSGRPQRSRGHHRR